MRKPGTKKHAGGSAASDAVEALVDPKTWPVLDDRFSNAVAGGASKRRYKGGGGCGDMEGGASKRSLKRGGGCGDMEGGGGCGHTDGGGGCGHTEGGASKRRYRGGGCACSGATGGGSVPASMPIGSNPYAPLNKHSAEARYNAASPNVKTFPKILSNKYGVPAASMASSGGAKKSVKSKATKPVTKSSKSVSSAKPAKKSSTMSAKKPSASPSKSTKSVSGAKATKNKPAAAKKSSKK